MIVEGSKAQNTYCITNEWSSLRKGIQIRRQGIATTTRWALGRRGALDLDTELVELSQYSGDGGGIRGLVTRVGIDKVRVVLPRGLNDPRPAR